MLFLAAYLHLGIYLPGPFDHPASSPKSWVRFISTDDQFEIDLPR